MKIYLLSEQRCLNGFLVFLGGFRGHCASLTVWAEVAFVGCLLMDSLSFFSCVFLVVSLYYVLCPSSFRLLAPPSAPFFYLSCWYYLSPHCLPSYESISIELCVSLCWQSLRFGVTAVMLPKGSVLFLPFLLFLLFPTIIWPFQCVRTGSAIYLFIFFILYLW